MNPENIPETIVNNAVRKYSYSNFPFFSKQSIKANLFGFLVFTGTVVLYELFVQSLDSHEVIAIISFFVALQALYYVFYVIPSVLYLRNTGRFLYIPPGYTLRLERAPFYSPLGEEPLRYGAQVAKWTYLKGTFWMVIFLLVIVMPFLAVMSNLVNL